LRQPFDRQGAATAGNPLSGFSFKYPGRLPVRPLAPAPPLLWLRKTLPAWTWNWTPGG